MTTPPDAAVQSAAEAPPAVQHLDRRQVTGSGRVVTKQGWPVAGAAVTLLGADGRQSARALSGGDGAFVLEQLPAGAGTLLVAAPAHDPVARTVMVPADHSWAIGSVQLNRTGVGPLPPAGIYLIDTAHSTISARAHHLGLASVTGRFADFAGVITVDGEDITRSSTEVRIAAASIDTGNAQRDAHLRSKDFLEVDTHPSLDFRSERLVRSDEHWRLPGELTLAGMTRAVELDLAYLGSGPDPWGGQRVAFEASTELRRQDFRLNWNRAVESGIAVFGTTLRITIEIEAVRQEASSEAVG